MAHYDVEDLIDFDDYPAGDTNKENDLDVFEQNDLVENDDYQNEDDFEQILNPSTTNETSDLLLNLLAEKGISDPSKIQIEEEDGTISEIDFNELPLEEQLEILNQNTPEVDLEDHEIETINFLRENNLSIDELIEYHRNLAVQEFLQSQQTSYTVDELSDEELYKLDLANRYTHLTEEDLALEIEKELNNPDLFKKKVDILREAYKQEELEEQTRLIRESELEQEQQYEELVQTMIETATSTNELFDLELEDDDKEEVLQFLLQKDVNGMTEFTKILNDPNALFQLAWFATKGQEAFNTIHDYYKKEIDLARKAKGSSTPSTKRTVIRKGGNTKGDDPYEIFN